MVRQPSPREAVGDALQRGLFRLFSVAMPVTRGRARPASRGTLGWLLAYVLSLVVSHIGLRHASPALPRIGIALLPLVPVVALAVLSVRRVLGMDELERRLEVVALAVTALVTWLALGTCWMLAHAGVALDPARIGFLGIPVLYLLARHGARRRYA
ncbi:MAG: hypothetical protein KGN77_01190 [Xanthomonadaceae bacterium]|nr:hypothetical protein [Xanthomonadaceae bacterium]MDE1963986.1 hypothetical protein [Xanthomonadaceae bacterium]